MGRLARIRQIVRLSIPEGTGPFDMPPRGLTGVTLDPLASILVARGAKTAFVSSGKNGYMLKCGKHVPCGR